MLDRRGRCSFQSVIESRRILRTVEAVVVKDGSLRLLEDVELREGERALVTILGGDAEANEAAQLSEPALAADWEREEEAEAWRHLQP